MITIREYEIFYSIRKPKSLPQMMDVYLILSDHHFDYDKSLTEEEVILREGLFALSDSVKIELGTTIKLLKYKKIIRNNKPGRVVQLYG